MVKSFIYNVQFLGNRGDRRKNAISGGGKLEADQVTGQIEKWTAGKNIFERCICFYCSDIFTSRRANGVVLHIQRQNSANSNGVDLIAYSPSDPPTAADWQALADKMNELITALRR